MKPQLKIDNFRNRIKEIIFVQKCIPCRFRKSYYKFRNLLFNINTQQYWDRIWESERTNPKLHRFHPILNKQIIEIIPKGSSVIDIGCGIGILMESIKIEKECDVFGVDISQQAISTIKEKNMNGIIAKVPPIPVNSDFFDVTVATELLEHINNPKELLKEMIRITKPMGFLIIAVPYNALGPALEREHVRVFDEIKVRNMLMKIKRVGKIEIFKTKEKNEPVYRLIIMAKKDN